MRRFISDGVYQRFHAQFTMMNLLGQSNLISGVAVRGLLIVRCYQDGLYDCIDIRITAEANDQFVCEKFPNLNSPGGREEFVEIWSFIRRSDFKRGFDIFSSNNCPKCAAPLTGKLIETARCPYCGSYLNSGEFDWVLSEITQQNDYGKPFAVTHRLPPFAAANETQIAAVYPAFSRQALEDRASNALMQILIGMAERDSHSNQGAIQSVQRFTTAQEFAELKAAIPIEHIVYDRLYTRAVDFLGMRIDGSHLHAFIGIEFCCHQINLDSRLSGARFAAFDLENSMRSQANVLVLYREITDAVAKGSIYAGTCPSCGAPQKDSLSPICEFCSASLNDPKLDWIVERFLSIDEFVKFVQ
jgi:hypothetical protein